jgi:hypothetical protein
MSSQRMNRLRQGQEQEEELKRHAPPSKRDENEVTHSFFFHAFSKQRRQVIFVRGLLIR